MLMLSIVVNVKSLPTITKKLFIASLYKKGDAWDISLMVNHKRITKSLRTKDYETEKRFNFLL